MNRRPRAPRARINADSRLVVYIATALVLTVGVASFVVSWSALVSVAKFAGVAEPQRVFVPILVDGALLCYQLVLVIQQERSTPTRATWASLWAFTSLSVAANAIHAFDADAGGYRTVLGVCLAAAAPLGVLAATHALASVAISPPPVVRKAPVAPVVVEVVAAVKAPARKRVAAVKAPVKAVPALTSAPVAAVQLVEGMSEADAKIEAKAARETQKAEVLRMHSENVHPNRIHEATGVSLTSVKRWIEKANPQVNAA